jgi:type IV pilus assembly protein PilO
MKLFWKKNHDIRKLSLDWRSQFKNLSGVDPWLWPKLPTIVLYGVVALAGYIFAWFFLLGSTVTAIQDMIAEEVTLKQSFTAKLSKANNLVFLKEKKQQAILLVSQLERQLPSTAEMDALLSDINQSGIERGLRFERLKPGAMEIKDYYAELPISMQVSGKFHDFAAFTAEVAALSRIVTLHNIQISSNKDGRDVLKIDATAKTYRYLNDNELSAQRKTKRDVEVKADQK